VVVLLVLEIEGVEDQQFFLGVVNAPVAAARVPFVVHVVDIHDVEVACAEQLFGFRVAQSLGVGRCCGLLLLDLQLCQFSLPCRNKPRWMKQLCRFSYAGSSESRGTPADIILAPSPLGLDEPFDVEDHSVWSHNAGILSLDLRRYCYAADQNLFATPEEKCAWSSKMQGQRLQ